MATEALTCPNCKAPTSTGPDPSGEYSCSYCGTRFRRAAAAPALNPAPVVVYVDRPQPTANKRAGLVVATVAGLVVLALVAGVALWSEAPEYSPNDPPVVEVGPAVEISAPAPTPATVPTPSTVVAKAPELPKPEPAVPATASFEFHRNLSGYKTSYFALGVVTNTSPFIIDKPKIIAVLLDADGKEIDTDFGFADADVLGPDQRAPVKILISDPPEHAAIRFEPVVRKASYVPPFVEGLRVEAMDPKPAAFGKDRWELQGKVIHDGDKPAKFVQIVAEARDAQDKLVGVQMSFADVEVLAPGAEARWSIDIQVAETADHFVFSVDGRPAD